MASTRPGNQNRGWNDPPEILHNTTDAPNVLNPQRSILNKRVAHNFGDGKPVVQQANDLPTLMFNPTPSTLVVTPTSDEITTPQQVDKSQDQPIPPELNLEVIERVLSEKLENLRTSSTSSKTVDDLAKRIKIFSNSWDKLSLAVKENMLKLANGKIFLATLRIFSRQILKDFCFS
jgi:hypothetical protein